MKQVNVFYPKKNFSSFDYMLNGKIQERVYDENGEFVEFKKHTPSIEYYENVSSPYVDENYSNDEIFEYVVKSHNIGTFPEKITEKIRNKELNVSFSSFSTGCVIQIEGCYYISNGFGFDLLPLEFSNDD